ncbi:hypothetical protein GCM10010244_56050 [Streptomyces coeruleorubidus]|nr:hypothetical protein GCM10010244_56050 [Streptomyces bellus]
MFPTQYGVQVACEWLELRERRPPTVVVEWEDGSTGRPLPGPQGDPFAPPVWDLHFSASCIKAPRRTGAAAARL